MDALLHMVEKHGDLKSLIQDWSSVYSIMDSVNGLTSLRGKKPLFSFGIISDIQYADIPDGLSFLGVPRYYRHSIAVLQRAVKQWNHHRNLKFAVNLGDIVDGFCPKEHSLDSVSRVVNEFEKFNGLVRHMIGNHCLYNMPRSKLLPLLKIPSIDGCAYYDFSPTSGYRFVVLDGYDISAIGWPEDHPKTQQALKFLQDKNPNSDKNSPDGLVGTERRFLMFNGAVGEEQLRWLDSVLCDATNLKQKVVVCCHLPLDPGASTEESLLWNFDEVMGVIHKYNCVKVCLAGHDHKDGHSIDSHGVHHKVFEAALECPPGTDAFGYIDVYDDRLSLCGTGRIESCDMHFNH
ncbi:manganese-dependent ADP-ribose/CDP-alcohol diphosphatase isoform X1 [Rhodamnia argentea]|uniref:Manganese-dependent ADP-ribose/CDP-alcohol diphosphatase n=2 Tax=Rhodamnia argentea TaxID=178133 RepID=A0A8B8P9R6_9MYRT|nr:manganese-dependent ADP-ribose/CDP-alcohol diphosphatase isoform X1 [Rhodamnia argentea]XP_048136429.1 manganese-dependent ADP-ribose/CDP-alcohol diphosphatase isoform X1 [Rhodamnia argentea]